MLHDRNHSTKWTGEGGETAFFMMSPPIIMVFPRSRDTDPMAVALRFPTVRAIRIDKVFHVNRSIFNGIDPLGDSITFRAFEW